MLQVVLPFKPSAPLFHRAIARPYRLVRFL